MIRQIAMALGMLTMIPQSATPAPQTFSNTSNTEFMLSAPQETVNPKLIIRGSNAYFELQADHMDDVEQAILTFNQSGQMVGRLSGVEYKNLKDAEASLDQVKKDIARAHGADPDGVTGHPATCAMRDNECIAWNNDATFSKRPDTFEFRGPFILINLPPEKQ